MKRTLIVPGLFFPIARSGGAQEFASMDRDGVQRVRLVAGDYFFRPNRTSRRRTALQTFTSSRRRNVWWLKC